MACPQWKDEYLVGVEEVDHQHRQLFALLADLRAAIDRQVSGNDLTEVVEALVAYLKEHFQSEEALLNHHPRWHDHHRQHWRFTEKVLTFLRELKRVQGRNGNELALEMHEFLCGWLASHIVEVDRSFFVERTFIA